MPEILELLEFLDEDRVPDMQVGRRRIETRLDLQGGAGLE